MSTRDPLAPTREQLAELARMNRELAFAELAPIVDALNAWFQKHSPHRSESDEQNR